VCSPGIGGALAQNIGVLSDDRDPVSAIAVNPRPPLRGDTVPSASPREPTSLALVDRAISFGWPL
jgi:hypothetical protein